MRIETALASGSGPDALDQDRVAAGGALPDLLRPAILRALPPRLRALVGGELEHDHPSGRHGAFERFGAPAPREITAAVLLDGRAGRPHVLRVARRVGHIDVEDDICSHTNCLPNRILRTSLRGGRLRPTRPSGPA